MIETFGKSFRDILDLKAAFFEENAKLLDRALRYAELYTSQPERTCCKICNIRLPNIPSFTKHTIPYVICQNCGHLNGMHEDSDAFCEIVYTSNGGKEYAENYTANDAAAYVQRRDAIYKPKVQFMADVLRNEGEDPQRLAYADMGAGAGYFVSAMLMEGLTEVSGFEVGKAQVDLGNWMMPTTPLRLISLKENLDLCEALPVDVMTFIGVFEHLQNPREILTAMRKNQAVRYFYFCVPMFGPCIFNEMAFPMVMPRQLSTGHTHLFTKSSISFIEKEFGLERVGAWWFGTDVMDYYRSIHVTLSLDPKLSGMRHYWSDLFEDIIDDMQIAIDNKRESSQVHMVFRIKR